MSSSKFPKHSFSASTRVGTGTCSTSSSTKPSSSWWAWLEKTGNGNTIRTRFSLLSHIRFILWPNDIQLGLILQSHVGYMITLQSHIEQDLINLQPHHLTHSLESCDQASFQTFKLQFGCSGFPT
ncbi:hypothetical protein TREMEDRAFT_57975 [Tremella mesenterica DSM 1558]|uniref:uncharacterized protein n=1 Tax=Tremella mesenterica (strain ATCC 24925 / CBS 8224 / DSM 1558 / NBRC 9311 / NRRL Y-6157 / RJB 2259-6 / UBC 559-6) TaxID=578456 RepID=UPI00032CDAF5|nr:uncharacterized protein TREMEDRAFT_57975 [Tremella mesenterica DSM 1558]EIW65580.1 hypothetical protein TREMEDRAFT_57975 [Tremella mesenterica DSM 1558]